MAHEAKVGQGSIVERRLFNLQRQAAGFDSLLEAARAIWLGHLASARRIVEGLPTFDSGDPSVDLKFQLFYRALAKRVGRDLSRESSLYLRDYGVKQIDLFNLMAKRMPFVSMGARLANEIIVGKIVTGSGAEPVLIDIGIGTGRQEVELLELLSSVNVRPKRLTIVGIEPAASALEIAQVKIEESARMLGQNIHFIPKQGFIENFSAATWSQLADLGQNILVNSAFSLHHVRGKDEVLRRIRELNPLRFVLTEPHSDHETDDYLKRFINAWEHFGLIFDAIDGLDLTFEERSAMKSQFFGREIEDIVGSPDQPRELSRSERHETGAQWEERLSRAGFELCVDAVKLPQKNGRIKATRRSRFFSLDYDAKQVVNTLVGA